MAGTFDGQSPWPIAMMEPQAAFGPPASFQASGGGRSE